MHLYVEERIIAPKEEFVCILIAHGFHKEVTIQDFPLRRNTVYIHVKRRRWFDKNTKEAVQRDWNLATQFRDAKKIEFFLYRIIKKLHKHNFWT